jgi:hypothetical protein
MALSYIIIGILIGLFIPGPFNMAIKAALKTLWDKALEKCKKI